MSGENGSPRPVARAERVGTPAQFGAELSRLREESRLTVREAARACGLAAATVGGYFTGTHLPTPKLIDAEFTALLRALGVREEAELQAWREAVPRIRRTVRRRAADQVLPFRGLARFERADAPWFFGRTALTGTLAERAAMRREAGRPLMVVGASGAGKSSLLRAGLLPLLDPDPDPAADTAVDPGTDAPGPAVLLTPGRDPAAALARALGGRRPPAWIVVDQFEELFTHGAAMDEQAAFVGALLDAAAAPAADRTGVVIGLRADFYTAALAHPRLARALQDGQVLVGAMDRAQLREAIAGPVQRAGAEIEDGLVELLIEQSMEFGREHAGTLPLLSHALLTTWRQCAGGPLTTADYLATGGIAHAVARSAEEAYAELTVAQQQLARQVFVHLVHVAEGAADTARRVTPAELPGADDAADLSETLGVFIDRRLLTADSDSVRITHEALIGSWPKLRSWLDEDRAALLAQRRVASAAETWRASGRDPAALLRGAPLAAAEGRMAEPGRRWRPAPPEREFLQASLAQRRAEERTRLRTTRQLRVLATALAVLLFVAAGTAVYAFAQRGQARQDTRLADSRAVAEAAEELRGLDPPAASQLSLAAYRIAPTTQARSALYESTDTALATRAVDGSSLVQALAVTPDRRTLAAADADGTLRLWDVADPGHPAALGPALLDLPHQQQFAVAISPDGRLLAVSGEQRTISLWDIGDPGRPQALPPLSGPRQSVYGLAFSPNGTLLAAAGADGDVRLFTVTGTAVRPGPVLAAGSGPGDTAQSVAFSPDGRTLAAGTGLGGLCLWSVPASGVPTRTASPPGLGSAVLALAFAPGGRLLASGTRAMHLQFWTLSGPGRVTADGGPLMAGNSWVNALAFSPDGTELAVGTSAKSVQLWSTATRSPVQQLAHPEPVASVVWDGPRTLVSGCADGVLRLWALPTPLLSAAGIVNAVAFSASGGVMAVASDTLRLWDPRTRLPLSAAFGPAAPAGPAPETVAFSRGAPLLAEGLADGTVRLWDIADPARPEPVGPVLRATTSGYVESIAVSPDGRTLATGADDGTVRLWDIADPAHPVTGPVLARFGGSASSVAFSATGGLLAAGSVDRSFRLWRVTGPGAAAALGSPVTALPGYVYSVTFSPSAPVLAVGLANGTVELWDTAAPARPTPYGAALDGPAGYVYALAFSPDGSTLAGAATDDNLWLWNVADARAPQVLATLTDATDSLFTVAFDPGGSLLAAGGADGHVHLWLSAPGPAAAALCADPGQVLSARDWARYAPGLPVTAPCR